MALGGKSRQHYNRGGGHTSSKLWRRRERGERGRGGEGSRGGGGERGGKERESGKE